MLEIVISIIVLSTSFSLLIIRRKFKMEAKKSNEFLKSYQEWYDGLKKGPKYLPKEEEIPADESEEENEAQGIESSAVQDEEDAEDE